VRNREIIGIVQPIQEVLNRIRWDPSYEGGRRFALTYVDHAKAIPVLVPFSSVTFDAGSSRMIGIEDGEGEVRKIPLHRIRQVFRDGVVIWARPSRAASGARLEPERAPESERSSESERSPGSERSSGPACSTSQGRSPGGDEGTG